MRYTVEKLAKLNFKSCLQNSEQFYIVPQDKIDAFKRCRVCSGNSVKIGQSGRNIAIRYLEH